MYGRRRYIPEINSNSYMVRQFGVRIATNTPIQGTAADIMKIAMINVYNRIKKEKLKTAIQVANLDFKIAQDQIKEIEAVFAKHPGGYEIVSISESQSEEIRAKKEWELVLREHSDVNVAINFAAESAEFCWEAANAQKLRENMLIYGVDDMPVTLQLIRDGKIDGSVVTSFYQYGYQGVKMLYQYVHEGKRPQNIDTNLIIVDKSNINHYRELNDGK